MQNGQIADVFDEVADLLEFQGANAFRVRAYRQGARTIREMQQSAAAVSKEGLETLITLPGIGKDLAAKCLELVQTGTLQMLEALRLEIPATVLA